MNWCDSILIDRGIVGVSLFPVLCCCGPVRSGPMIRKWFCVGRRSHSILVPTSQQNDVRQTDQTSDQTKLSHRSIESIIKVFIWNQFEIYVKFDTLDRDGNNGWAEGDTIQLSVHNSYHLRHIPSLFEHVN